MITPAISTQGLAFTCERSDEKTLVVANTAWSWRVQQGRKFFEVSDQTRDKAVRLRAKAAGNSLLDPAFQVCAMNKHFVLFPPQAYAMLRMISTSSR